MTPAAARPASIRRLSLHSIRTYERLTLQLDDGVTVLVGPNGVGKTNLLEACAMVLAGSSPRTSSELRLIRDGAQAARIGAHVRIGSDEHDRDVVLQAGRGKQLREDGAVVRGIDAFAARVPVVSFLPERLLVIRGAPQRRRAIVDQLAARLSAPAAQLQREYATALQQRNALLRRARIGHDIDQQLQPWTQQLVELGTQYRAQRAELLGTLAPHFTARFEQLTGLTGGSFEPTLRGCGDLAADAVELASAERRRGSTLLGPHLDDVLPRSDGRDLRAFGSAGEQRSSLLAYTFAARDVLAAHTGVEPVVLLDEPWSELDADRRRRLSALLAPLTQVIATSTEPPAHLASVVPRCTVLAVSCGNVTPWPDHPDTAPNAPSPAAG